MRVWWASVLGGALLTSFLAGGWTLNQITAQLSPSQQANTTAPKPDIITAPRNSKAQSDRFNHRYMAEGALPNFNAFKDVRERKRAFFNFLLPVVETANRHIMEERRLIVNLRARQNQLSEAEQGMLHRLARKYRVPFEPDNQDFWNKLLERVDVLPPSLVLAQAAIESAWGTSRFAVEGNNLFGVWCFTPGCGLPPLNRDEGKSHEVRRYPNVLASVEDYMLNLNRHSHYEALRKLRARLRSEGVPLTGTALATALARYSEQGDAYITLVTDMIRQNRLEKYDMLAGEIPAKG